MAIEVDYADTQHYLQHFRDHGCDTDIVDNTAGLINLFWLNVDLIDQLNVELEKKTVTIVRRKEMISGMNSTSRAPSDSDKTSGRAPPLDDSMPADAMGSRKKPAKTKGHGRRGVNDYRGAK